MHESQKELLSEKYRKLGKVFRKIWKNARENFFPFFARLVYSLGQTREAPCQVLAPWVSTLRWRLHWIWRRWKNTLHITTITTEYYHWLLTLTNITDPFHNKGSLECDFVTVLFIWQIHSEEWCTTGGGDSRSQLSPEAEHSWSMCQQSVRNRPFLPLSQLHVSAQRCTWPMCSHAEMQPALGDGCKGLFPNS